MADQFLVLFIFLSFGGLLKGVLGMGTPIIAVPAIAAFYGVPFAIAVMVIPNLVTNFTQVWQFRAVRSRIPFLATFVASGIGGVLVGTWLLAALPEDILSLVLAGTVVAYIGLRLARPDWSISQIAAIRLAPFAGAASGLMQGATGISAPVSATFLNAQRLSRPEFAFTVSALFAGFALLQVPALAVARILNGDTALVGVLAIAPILLGMWLGNAIAPRLNARAFDQLVLGVLATIALKLIYDVLAGA